MNVRQSSIAIAFAALGIASATGLTTQSALATADLAECVETLTVYDPYDLIDDPDLAVDFGTRLDVESLVDDYTGRIDDAVDAESEDLVPPEDVSSDDLIDEARWEIDDATELGRSIAECDE